MNFQGFVDVVKQNRWELHGIEVFQDGQVVEQYQGKTGRHPVYSATKSVTSLAVGMAVEDGKFDIHAPLYEYLKSDVPAYASAEQLENLKKITIQRLLTMSVKGYPFRPEGDNWLEYSLMYPLQNVEEQEFDYSNISAYLVGVAAAKALNRHLYDYLEERLFEPLEIQKPEYQNCPSGYFYGASGMYLTVQELSKIGQVCLQKGIYKGQRIVSEEYLAEATGVQLKNKEGGYGYYFWKYKDGYRISGKWGQRCLIFPERELMVTYLSNMEHGSEKLAKAVEEWIL